MSRANIEQNPMQLPREDPVAETLRAQGALAGITVVDFGEMVSGPYCAKLFADYGANVIKVELPEGDAARRAGPFPGDRPDPERSGLYFICNTNKRGVTCDVRTEAGREQFLQLLGRADVLIENRPPAQMREWGLDYAQLAAANPDLVVISITPYGQTGPYSEWKGTDLNAFHLTGSGSRYCGRPGEMPLKHGTFSADYFGAVAGAAWGLAAVFGRALVGGGQHLDVSCAEAIAAVFVGGQNIGGYAQDGRFDRRTGVGMSQAAPATILPCRDGHAWILAIEDNQWKGLCRAMGDPEWASLEMFNNRQVRAENGDILCAFIREWSAQHGKLEIMEACQAEGCPVTAVYTVEEVAQQAHLAARRHFVDIEHPTLGRLRTLGAPFRLPASPGGPRRAAPLLGEHTPEILGRTHSLPAADNALPRVISIETSDHEVDRNLPLRGVRVLNLGWVWAGPVVGQTLGFLGAEVIKVESRTRIDLLRTLPPFAGNQPDPDRCLFNHAAWAGNGSITLDLKQPEALELLRRLVPLCDVVVENFGPGVMERLGLGYDVLQQLRNDIILFSMPAAGLDGPLKDVRTYGLSLASLTGLDSLTGYKGEGPTPMENAFCDPFVGIFGAFAALTALQHRQRTGQGQHVEFSQQEAVMQLIGPAYMDYVLNGRVAVPRGNEHPTAAAAPHSLFRCRGEDRWISIAVTTEQEWLGLLEAMGRPPWALAPGFSTLAGRLAGIDGLHARLGEWTEGFDDRELASLLQRHGVAAAPVLNIADLLHDPHYRARGTYVEVTHPLGFRETIFGPYVKMSRSRPQVRPGPCMGQDNERVFGELLDLPVERYRELVERRVIY